MRDANQTPVTVTDPRPLSTPDITAAQVLAAVSALVGLYVSLGVVDGRTGQVITGTASIMLPLVWVLADALIRHGRSRALSLPPRGLVQDEREG